MLPGSKLRNICKFRNLRTCRHEPRDRTARAWSAPPKPQALGTLIDTSVLIAVERGQLDPDVVFATAERRYATLAELAITGTRMGAHDLLIAAIAVHL